MRWIQINGQLIPADEAAAAVEPMHHIQGALKPFVSMLDGSIVTSRSKYQADLKAHGMVEIGNELTHLQRKPIPDVAAQQRKELIRAQINALGHEGFKKALHRDIEFVKWNSRGLPR